MRNRTLRCVMVMPIVTVLCAFAPQRQSTADPITGTWTGTFLPQGAESGRKVQFELKYDGKGAVSGAFSGLQSPGNVKRGSFDVKTGALKLELGKRDEDTVLLTLEGRVSGAVATGRFTGEMSGECRIEKQGSGREK